MDLLHVCHSQVLPVRDTYSEIFADGESDCSYTRVWMQSMGRLPVQLLTTAIHDGYRKQARRTGMAGPLGEMFDHGMQEISSSEDQFLILYRLRCSEYHCEWHSMCCCTPLDISFKLEVILAARALNLGRSWWTVASQIATLANFYLTTWEEYHTGMPVSF